MRYIDTELARPRWRFTGNCRVGRNLQIGIEVNPAAQELAPLLTWYWLTETHRRPALFVGTSSDRIGSPAGRQSYYLTAAKHLPRTPLALYASVTYSEWDRALTFPAGGSVMLPFHFTLRPMYDGRRPHLLLAHEHHRFHVAVLYVWFERIGVALAAGF
ncbi:MAG: hypothetical protein ONB48_12675 [candidate division KSB1 bacterium]|nr:hypothetical protein [candidate division KSB1 bacterium]MDZ7275051.1 hypothetical protein [candidate division KSB1 bacterium]MDZ7286501.1 hypothetical protein [candidate division KSB1 bacterium]MDZ7299335.1 hypothetical protein [candidate division KSB1 bacterium]MDZ7307007.1 hypothetical protein [candidate division KSB1 bacterium]